MTAPQTHTIHVTNDIDYLHFTVSTGHNYRFETTLLDASMDTYIYLLASDGTTVLEEDDDSGIGWGSLIEYPFNASGTNYILIEHYALHHGTSAGSTGAYSIAMTDLGEAGTLGTTKWRKNWLMFSYLLAPAIDTNGVIYLGSAVPAGLYAFNPDGSTARVWNASSFIYSAPAIASDGTIYLGLVDGSVCAYNPDGTTGHVWNIGVFTHGTPAIGPDGTIYVGSTNKNLYAFNPDGTTGHVWTTEAAIYASPAIGADGSIYIGSNDSNLYCFASSGATSHVWRADGALYFSSPAIGTNGIIYIGALSGNLYGFNPDGTTNHIWHTTNAIVSTPVIGSNDTIYVGSLDGNLYAFNPDGTTGHIWTVGSMRSAPLISSDGSIYACVNLVYNLNQDGTTNWSSGYTCGYSGGPAIDTNGILYYISDSKLVAMYATGSLAQTAWPKYQHDLKNTGMVSPAPSTNVTATDGLYNNQITINWSPVQFASGYNVLRGTNNVYASALAHTSGITTTNYNDTNAAAGITYYYWVQTRNNSGINVAASPADTGWQHTFVSSAAGDYDHDGLADPAVYNHTNRNWKIRFSGANYVLATAANLLGGAGFTAATADYDGDGKADPAVYEEATGNWTVMLTTANYAPITVYNLLGAQGYSGLAGDFDGDAKADPTIYNESNGYWIFRSSSNNYVEVALTQTLGGQGWCAVLADYDGDQLVDQGVYHEASGTWAVRLSNFRRFLYSA